jgi:hypothetical protein
MQPVVVLPLLLLLLPPSPVEVLPEELPQLARKSVPESVHAAQIAIER